MLSTPPPYGEDANESDEETARTRLADILPGGLMDELYLDEDDDWGDGEKTDVIHGNPFKSDPPEA